VGQLDFDVDKIVFVIMTADADQPRRPRASAPTSPRPASSIP
jgi:hypothetical protein